MFKTTSTLKLPANSQQPLWRYFSYERFRDLIFSEELFFAHLFQLPDGLEGSLTAMTRDKLIETFFKINGDMTIAQKDVEQYENFLKDFFVNCWHMNNTESYLMWKVYGRKSGFAIRTTFERIQAAFDCFDGAITGGIVDYIDFERDITQLGNVLPHAITKDLPYKDECEFRLIFWIPDPMNKGIAIAPNGVRVRVNLQKLIERIYVSPIEKEVPSELCEILECKRIECSPSVIKARNDP